MKLFISSMLVAATAISIAGCGIFTAPWSVAAAVAQNSNFSFKGKVVDGNGQTLDGIVVTVANSHHLWTPMAGSTDLDEPLTRRVDGKFAFETRGTYSEFTFSKDGYYDAYYRLNADHPDEIYTRDGIWHNGDNFSVVMLASRTPAAPLVHFNAPISYADYPICNVIALPNLATNGVSGDVTYTGKNAEDPTIFPAGTLYATLDKEPPAAINAKGDIDVADLDIPHHITLHIPGAGGGLIRIEPRTGFEPMKTSDSAPANGYVRDLTFTRVRLKEMRASRSDNIIEAHEYFFFHADHFYGKGVFSWAAQSGKPSFQYELYVQPEPDSRDLAMHVKR